MVSAIGNQHRQAAETRPKPAKTEPGEGFAPGKSADSVGHRAEAMAAESGDTDSGAQGRAASTIARMDITVLAPQSEEPPLE